MFSNYSPSPPAPPKNSKPEMSGFHLPLEKKKQRGGVRARGQAPGPAVARWWPRVPWPPPRVRMQTCPEECVRLGCSARPSCCEKAVKRHQRESAVFQTTSLLDLLLSQFPWRRGHSPCLTNHHGVGAQLTGRKKKDLRISIMRHSGLKLIIPFFFFPTEYGITFSIIMIK